MIQEQLQTSESHEKKTRLGLTVEESFFIELLEKQDPSIINVKFTKNGSQLVKIEQFKNYYSEPEIVQLLESLVAKGRIQKKEKGVVLLCPKCSSHAIMTLLICPRCGSAKVGRREDLYHANCEYWGPREEFIEGLLLRCPRCNELLDEDAPDGTPGYYSISDSHFECNDCGTSVSKNNLKMVCLKCSSKFTSVQASYLNSVSYILVPEGEVVVPKKRPVKQRAPPVEKPVISEPKKTEKPIISEPMQIEETEPQEIDEPEVQLEPIQEEVTPEVKPEPEPESQQETIPQAKPELKEEIISEPKEEVKKEKPKQEILQKSIERLSKLLKPKKKKKRKKKSKPKKEPVEKPVEEPEEKPVEEPQEEPQEVSQEEQMEEIQEESEKVEVIEKEQQVEPFAQKVLLIVENVTVSEFIIESLEEVKTPIEVLHVDDGKTALKELRTKYDVVIIDLDLKTIESKLILKEMEKWEIMTPIIALSDDGHKIEKYSLNIQATLKKKQSDYRKIKKIIKSL